MTTSPPTPDRTAVTVIEPGVLFSWLDSDRPMLTIKPDPPDLPITVDGGYFLMMARPHRWWYVRSWVRVARALWRMP